VGAHHTGRESAGPYGPQIGISGDFTGPLWVAYRTTNSPAYKKIRRVPRRTVGEGGRGRILGVGCTLRVHQPPQRYSDFYLCDDGRSGAAVASRKYWRCNVSDHYGAPALVGVGAAYREGYTSPYLVNVHAIADDGSHLIASLNLAQDLCEFLVVTINGQEVARAHGIEIFRVMHRYGIALEFPADIRRSLAFSWGSFVGVDMRNIVWWG
jgi:hypothetical protein